MSSYPKAILHFLSRTGISCFACSAVVLIQALVADSHAQWSPWVSVGDLHNIIGDPSTIANGERILGAQDCVRWDDEKLSCFAMGRNDRVLVATWVEDHWQKSSKGWGRWDVLNGIPSSASAAQSYKYRHDPPECFLFGYPHCIKNFNSKLHVRFFDGLGWNRTGWYETNPESSVSFSSEASCVELFPDETASSIKCMALDQNGHILQASVIQIGRLSEWTWFANGPVVEKGLNGEILEIKNRFKDKPTCVNSGRSEIVCIARHENLKYYANEFIGGEGWGEWTTASAAQTKNFELGGRPSQPECFMDQHKNIRCLVLNQPFYNKAARIVEFVRDRDTKEWSQTIIADDFQYWGGISCVSWRIVDQLCLSRGGSEEVELYDKGNVSPDRVLVQKFVDGQWLDDVQWLSQPALVRPFRSAFPSGVISRPECVAHDASAIQCFILGNDNQLKTTWITSASDNLSDISLAALPEIAQNTRIENAPIWRLELRVHVCDRNGAASVGNEKLWFKTSEDPYNRQWLFTKRLKRGSWVVWDLLPVNGELNGNLHSVGNFTELTLGIEGGNFCFDDLEIYANNPSSDLRGQSHSNIFVGPGGVGRSTDDDTRRRHRIYSLATERGHTAERWLNTNANSSNSITLEIRKGPIPFGSEWNLLNNRVSILLNQLPIAITAKDAFHNIDLSETDFAELESQRLVLNDFKFGVEREILESIIESGLSHDMRPCKTYGLIEDCGETRSLAKWGKRRGAEWVRITHKNDHPDNVATIDLDIVRRRAKEKRTRAFDIDFDIRFRCVGDQLIMETLNTDVDVRFGVRFAPFFLGSAIGIAANVSLNKLLEDFEISEQENVSLPELCNLDGYYGPTFVDNHHDLQLASSVYSEMSGINLPLKSDEKSSLTLYTKLDFRDYEGGERFATDSNIIDLESHPDSVGKGPYKSIQVSYGYGNRIWLLCSRPRFNGWCTPIPRNTNRIQLGKTEDNEINFTTDYLKAESELGTYSSAVIRGVQSARATDAGFDVVVFDSPGVISGSRLRRDVTWGQRSISRWRGIDLQRTGIDQDISSAIVYEGAWFVCKVETPTSAQRQDNEICRNIEAAEDNPNFISFRYTPGWDGWDNSIRSVGLVRD